MLLASMLALSVVGLIVVSPAGDDSNPGTPDQPLATLQTAVDRAAQSPEPTTIRLAPGTYRLAEPVRIRGNQAPLTLQAEESGTAILSGSLRIESWTPQPDGSWSAPTEPGHRFSQLWANGQRRLRPRLPGEGYALIEARLTPLPENAGKGTDGFIYPEGSFDSAWANRDDVEVLVWRDWSIARSSIRSIDPETRQVRFKLPSGIDQWWASDREGYRFIVENVAEAFGRPGEWYLDAPAATLRYSPLPAESPEDTVIEVPRTEVLIQIGEEGRTTAGVTLQGLTLENTQWNNPREGRFFYQAEADLGGAIEVAYAQDVRIQGCNILRTGAHAIRIRSGVQRATVADCTLVDLGGGGVYVGEMQKIDDPARLTEQVEVRGCRILGYGRLHPAAVGLWIGQNPNNVLAENWIEDGYYSGISVGWSWGYAESGSHHNRIENNDILKVGQRVMSDMGGIYTLSPSPGTVVRGNRIRQVSSYGYGGWGIYPDEGSTDILVEENVVWDTWSEGFHCHYGKDILVRNNVFAFGREAQVRRSRAEEHRSLVFERNLVVFASEQLVGDGYAGTPEQGTAFTQNLYWQVDQTPFRMGPHTWEQWLALGQDGGTVLADPGFRDPASGDFRLKADSPALGIGFRPFDRLAPSTRPSGLPERISPGFPIPTDFVAPVFN